MSNHIPTTKVQVLTLLLASCGLGLLSTPAVSKGPNKASPWDQTFFEIVTTNNDREVVYRQERGTATPKYQVVGIAFAVDQTNLASDSDVFGVFNADAPDQFFVRNTKGQLYPIDKFTRFDSYRKLATFEVRGHKTAFRPLTVGRNISINGQACTPIRIEAGWQNVCHGTIAGVTAESLKGHYQILQVSSGQKILTPGGTPLLDRKNKLVGIMRTTKALERNRQPATYAIELLKVRKGKALFFEPKAGQDMGVAKDWIYTTYLPKALSELRKSAVLSRKKHYLNLTKTALKTRLKSLQSPTSGFQEGLYNQIPSAPLVTYVEKNGKWQMQPVLLEATKNPEIFRSDKKVFGMLAYAINTKNANTLSQLLQKPHVILNKIIPSEPEFTNLRGLRSSPKVVFFRDFAGRNWFEAQWDLQRDASKVIMLYTQTPNGAYILIDTPFSADFPPYYQARRKLDLTFLMITYSGSKPELDLFLRDPMRPRALNEAKLSQEDDEFTLNAGNLSLAFTKASPKKSERFDITIGLAPAPKPVSTVLSLSRTLLPENAVVNVRRIFKPTKNYAAAFKLFQRMADNDAPFDATARPAKGGYRAQSIAEDGQSKSLIMTTCFGADESVVDEACGGYDENLDDL